MKKTRFDLKKWISDYKNIKIIILALVGLVFLFSLITFFRETSSLYKVSLGGTEIALPETSEAGIYSISDEFLVKKGSYTYTVTYTAEGAQGSFIWPFSDVEHFNAFEQVPTYLGDGTYTVTDTMWVNEDVMMYLRLLYTGEGSVSIDSFSMNATSRLQGIELFCSIMLCLTVLALLWLYDYRRHHPENKILVPAIVAVLGATVLSSFPALFAAVGDGNDMGFHLTRIQGVAEAFLSGQFPVRLNPTFYNGYGYADPEYYGSLLLYVPAVLYLIGFRLTTAYNIYVVLINLLTASLAYYSIKKIANDGYIAMIGAFIYSMAPYRILCLYYRSAVGEYSAMAFFPLILYGMWRIYTMNPGDKRFKLSFIPLVIGLTGLIQTHILSCEMVGAVIILVCILQLKKTFVLKRFLQLLAAAIGTLLVNLWFLLPFADSMLHQLVKINVVGTQVSSMQSTGLFFTQMFTMFPLYSLITTGASEGATYKSEFPLILGMVFLLGGILFLIVHSYNSEDKTLRKGGMFVFVLGVLTAWMTTIYFPWDKITTVLGYVSPVFTNLITSMQFVWRLLGISTVLLTVATVAGLVLLKQHNKEMLKAAAVGLCVVAIITPMYMMENSIQNQKNLVLNDISDIGYNTACTVSGAEYSLIGNSWDVMNGIFEARTYNGAEISDYHKNGTTVDLKVTASGSDGYVLLPLLAYRGYSAKGDTGVINGSLISSGEDSVVRLDIPAGYTGSVRVYFKGFWYWRLAEIISVLSCALICAYGVLKLRKQDK